MPRVGSKWSHPDGKYFIVVGVREVDNNTWVDYVRIGTDHTYSCFLEAFLTRYYEENNGS